MSANTTRTRLLRDWNEQGEAVRIEILCSSCGFGAVVTVPPARCPMCGSNCWAGVAPSGTNRVGRDGATHLATSKSDEPRLTDQQGEPRWPAEKGASHGRTRL
jgi:hypothetical protein